MNKQREKFMGKIYYSNEEIASAIEYILFQMFACVILFQTLKINS